MSLSDEIRASLKEFDEYPDGEIEVWGYDELDKFMSKLFSTLEDCLDLAVEKEEEE